MSKVRRYFCVQKISAGVNTVKWPITLLHDGVVMDVRAYHYDAVVSRPAAYVVDETFNNVTSPHPGVDNGLGFPIVFPPIISAVNVADLNDFVISSGNYFALSADSISIPAAIVSYVIVTVLEL